MQMAEEKCKKSKKVLDKYKSLCYNIKDQYTFRSYKVLLVQ